MDRVGVRELRQNLSVYLRRVRAGERLEVTERGEAVATLEPIVEQDDPLTALEREGIKIRRASGSLSAIGPPLRLPGVSLSDALEEQREDRL